VIVVGAFALATALGQALLRGGKVQSHSGLLAAVHLAVALPVLGVLALRQHAGLVGPILFWTGAGLTWFVVRSHLEGSILLAMLDDVEQGCGDRSALVRRYRARGGFTARLGALHEAGVIRDEAGEARVTRKGRMVLAFFRLLGAGSK
jgi:hypothetical protein